MNRFDHFICHSQSQVTVSHRILKNFNENTYVCQRSTIEIDSKDNMNENKYLRKILQVILSEANRI